MWNMPTTEELSKLPGLYETEKVPLKKKIVHMHFFISGCDWWAVEYDPRTKLFFGFVILNGDLLNAEWGYFNLEELDDIHLKYLEVDRDLHFEPQTAEEIKEIREAQSW